MFAIRAAKMFLLAWFLFCATPAYSQLIVFENSELYSGRIAALTDEYGDEVILAGAARVLTKITFEYRGDFFANFDEKAKIRIYANSGPSWMGNQDYPLPTNTPLWESSLFIINPGFHTQVIPIPSIEVPQRFTWTIQFYGLSMRSGISTLDPGITNDIAGLLFYGLPSIGITYNDFWERYPTLGWTPVQVSGVYKNNFGMRITAIPEPTVPNLAIEKVGTKIRVRWPRFLDGYTLQSKTALDGEWATVPNFVEQNGDFREIFFPYASPLNRFFRLARSVPMIPSLNLVVEKLGTKIRVRWSRFPTGFALQSKTALDGEWTIVPDPIEQNGDFNETLFSNNTPINRFFRLVGSAILPTPTVVPEENNTRVSWPFSATGYVLQSKLETEASWTDIETPVIPTGESFSVLIRGTNTTRLFRLRETMYAARLKISRENGNIRLRWPAAARGYRLQTTPASSMGNWTDISTPTIAEGDHFDVVIPISGAGQIFRVIQ